MVNWSTPAKSQRWLRTLKGLAVCSFPGLSVDSAPPLIGLVCLPVYKMLLVLEWGLLEDVVAGFKTCVLKPFSQKNAIHSNQGFFFLSSIPSVFSSVVPIEGQHRPGVDCPSALEVPKSRCFIPHTHCARRVTPSPSCLWSLCRGAWSGETWAEGVPRIQSAVWTLQMWKEWTSYSHLLVGLIQHRTKVSSVKFVNVSCSKVIVT